MTTRYASFSLLLVLLVSSMAAFAQPDNNWGSVNLTAIDFHFTRQPYAAYPWINASQSAESYLAVTLSVQGTPQAPYPTWTISIRSGSANGPTVSTHNFTYNPYHTVENPLDPAISLPSTASTYPYFAVLTAGPGSAAPDSDTAYVVQASWDAEYELVGRDDPTHYTNPWHGVTPHVTPESMRALVGGYQSTNTNVFTVRTGALQQSPYANLCEIHGGTTSGIAQLQAHLVMGGTDYGACGQVNVSCIGCYFPDISPYLETPPYYVGRQSLLQHELSPIVTPAWYKPLVEFTQSPFDAGDPEGQGVIQMIRQYFGSTDTLSFRIWGAGEGSHSGKLKLFAEVSIGGDKCGYAEVHNIGVSYDPNPLAIPLWNAGPPPDPLVEWPVTIVPSEDQDKVTFWAENQAIAEITGSAPTLSVKGKAVGVTTAQSQVVMEQAFPDRCGSSEIYVYDVEIISCPAFFIPGHTNLITYRILSDGYNPTYSKFEIFARDEYGNPTGPVVATMTEINLSGQNNHTFSYNGTEITYDPGKYIAKISVGSDEYNLAFDTVPFDVRAWDLFYFFWDTLTEEEIVEIILNDEEATQPYCAGVDYTTVTSEKVTVKLWYWDETENGALLLTIDDGVPTIGYPDWPPEWGDKTWYDDRGAAFSDLNGTFYTMSEEGQWFFLRVTVANDGVYDNVGNEFDSDEITAGIQKMRLFKLKIDALGIVTVIEEVSG